MKVKLIKPYKIAARDRNIGVVLDVTRAFAAELIAEGVAEELNHPAKHKKTKV